MSAANLRAIAESEALARFLPASLSDPLPSYWQHGPDSAPRPIWLDCDPGHDDAMAILLAAYTPRLRLLGISTVAGNQSLPLCTANALAVLHAAGVEGVPVYEGQAGPLLPTNGRPSCPEIHGHTGLDGPHGGRIFPDAPSRPSPGLAAVRMAEALLAARTDAHRDRGHRPALVCTGSLTNAALALTLFPALRDSVEVILMGGAVAVGNTSPGAEFNLQNDPEAAAIVIESGCPVTLVPLEVTHTARVTPAVVDRVRAAPATEFRRRCADLLLFFAATYKNVFFFDDPPLHDPLAVLFAAEPELFRGRRVRCDVALSSERCPGRTVFDLWGQTGRAANVTLCLQCDVPAFWDRMLGAIAAADRGSPLNLNGELATRC